MYKYKRIEDPELKRVKSEVLKRDEYKCQLCGKSKTRLNLHHIQKWASSPSIRNDSRNLICLCWECHKNIRGKESYYASLFTSIVFQNESKKK